MLSVQETHIYHTHYHTHVSHMYHTWVFQHLSLHQRPNRD